MRSTLLGILFAVSCAASPPFQAADDAETLYKKMESALAAAKTLTVEYESSAEGASTRGTFKIDEGNKFELKVNGTAGERKYTLEIKADGKTMKLVRGETPAPPVPLEEQPELPAPANLTPNIAGAFARGGAWLAQEFADVEYRRTADPWFIERQSAKEQQRAMKPVAPPPPRDVASLHTISGFRKDGGAVSYEIAPKDERPLVILTVTVWIDERGMPTKREGRFFAVKDGKPAGEALSKWTETYKIR